MPISDMREYARAPAWRIPLPAAASDGAGEITSGNRRPSPSTVGAVSGRRASSINMVRGAAQRRKSALVYPQGTLKTHENQL